MLISHTGDVTETRAGTTAVWVLVLTDRTSGTELIVHCKGQLIEAAKLAKIGQVIEVLGVANREPWPSRVIAVNPITLRAKSGTNEGDINRIASEYTNALLDGNALSKATALEADLDLAKATIAAAEANSRTIRHERDDAEDRARYLAERIEQLEHDLQAERIMNSVMGGTT